MNKWNRNKKKICISTTKNDTLQYKSNKMCTRSIGGKGKLTKPR